MTDRDPPHPRHRDANGTSPYGEVFGWLMSQMALGAGARDLVA